MAVLGAAAAAAVVCTLFGAARASASSARARAPPPLPAATPPLPAATPPRSAFYVLFANQVTNNPAWPVVCQNNGAGPQGGECVNMTDYAGGVVIMSPQNVTPAVAAQVRAAAPGARVAAYWDFGELPWLNATAGAELNTTCPCCTGHVMGDLPGRNCSTTYACGAGSFTDALAAAVPPTALVARLDDPQAPPGTRVVQCAYPGLAMFVPSAQSALLVADFVGGFVLEAGFDGVYLDGYEPPTVKSVACAGACDYNGDGQADSPKEALAQYTAWAPALVARLRSRLGPSALLLANSAGPLSDSSLDGLTIEMEACLDARACTDAMLGQAAASAAARPGSAIASVFWLTHAEVMNASQQCAEVAAWQAAHPFILQGTDFFDGSHISCAAGAVDGGR